MWLYQVELGHALQKLGKVDAAQAKYARARQLKPDWPETVNAEAWRLATAPGVQERNGLLAVYLASLVCEATNAGDPAYLDTLAAAYAEMGQFKEAQATVRRAMSLVSPAEARPGKVIATSSGSLPGGPGLPSGPVARRLTGTVCDPVAILPTK